MKKYSLNETITFADLINKTCCLEDLNVLISREGCMETIPFFIENEVAIDMDCVEVLISNELSRNRNKSMDSAFIITENDFEESEILLVEFRFNYTCMRNIKKDSLLGKVEGTINALNNQLNIHPEYIFVFNSNLIQQAIRRFRNINPKLPTNYKITDIAGLKHLFFD